MEIRIIIINNNQNTVKEFTGEHCIVDTIQWLTTSLPVCEKYNQESKSDEIIEELPKKKFYK